MISEKMLELLVFLNIESVTEINPNLDNWLSENYDTQKINRRYLTLINEFLTDYALNKTEKSE